MGWPGGTGRMGRELCPPAYPGRPAYPARLETHLESQLELPLLVPRRIHELVRIGRNRRERIAGCIDRLRRRDARHFLCIENVLELRDDFAANRTADRNPPR